MNVPDLESGVEPPSQSKNNWKEPLTNSSSFCCNATRSFHGYWCLALKHPYREESSKKKQPYSSIFNFKLFPSSRKVITGSNMHNVNKILVHTHTQTHPCTAICLIFINVIQVHSLAPCPFPNPNHDNLPLTITGSLPEANFNCKLKTTFNA